MDIDLRKEAEYLLENYGIDAVYVRNSRYARCKCYDELYKLGKPKCTKCFGTGKVTTMEKVKVFYNNDSYYTKQSGAGKYNAKVGDFIFKFNSTVKFNDILLIVGFKNNIITDVKQVYKINNANEIRGDRGRVEFYEVDVLSDNALVLLYDKYVKSNKLNINALSSNIIVKE